MADPRTNQRDERLRHCPLHGEYMSVNHSMCPTCHANMRRDDARHATVKQPGGYWKLRDAHLGAKGGE